MPEISYKKGYTFRVGPINNMQFARIDIEIAKVDTNLPTAPQLEDASITITEIHKVLDAKVDAAVEEVLDANPEGEKK